jgi:hypothetical protein
VKLLFQDIKSRLGIVEVHRAMSGLRTPRRIRNILLTKLDSFGSILLCIDRIYVSDTRIIPSKHNSLPSIIYLVIRLKCFDPLLGHYQAYIKTRKCITFYILRAKRDPVWFTGLYTVCTGSNEKMES